MTGKRLIAFLDAADVVAEVNEANNIVPTDPLSTAQPLAVQWTDWIIQFLSR